MNFKFFFFFIKKNSKAHYFLIDMSNYSYLLAFLNGKIRFSGSNKFLKDF